MLNFYLILIGFVAGTIGTLIGAGGGFILVPILLMVYPDKSPELITSISLAVVCINAISGSVNYAFKKRIDYRSALLFSTTTLPGSILGSVLVGYIPRNIFDLIFGITLLGLCIYLLIKPLKTESHHSNNLTWNIWPIRRSLQDQQGNAYSYAYDLVLACLLSFIIGIAASILGIGGGIIHVPVMINLLNFPVHIATATSHFVLALMGASASATHWVKGDLNAVLSEILFLGIGVVVGAQLGATLSHKLKAVVIIRALAVALGIVALRVFWMCFRH